MDFHDRHVMVTGGTGALGVAVVTALSDAGATCHVPYVVASEADNFPLRERANVKLIQADTLAHEATVARIFAEPPELWASIHLAGGFAAGKLHEAEVSALRQQIDINLMTSLLCCRAAARRMRGRGGRIVNVAARPAIEPRSGGGMVAYTAAKAAVAALTVALAEEVVGDGILVNAVAPSIMDTPANRAAMPKADHASWPKVGDVAATVLFLASPDNAVTRGAVVPVYGRA